MEKVNEIVSKNMPELKKRSDTCRICGKEFEPQEWDQRYCSTECVEKFKAEKTKKMIEGNIHAFIPPKYQEMETDRKDILTKYKGKSLFITGAAGVGKTVLMASIAKNIIRENKPLDWISYPAFIMELQSMFKKDLKYDGRIPETPFDVADKIAKFNGWLCIDDIGAEKLTDYVRQITYFIINEREQRMLPIIITSNFTLAQIDEMVDPRVSSRIAGMCETIKLTGKDRRIRI
jgi:DNA replication protein DnaC